MKWLRDRVVAYPRILIPFYAISLIVVFASARWSPSGTTDLMGYPLGRDFSAFWQASAMSRAGDASSVYDPSVFNEALQARFHTSAAYGWFYPPTFLLIVHPLASLPYLVSLFVWLGTTLAGYLAVLRRIAPQPRTLWLALSFSGTYENILFSQNGFLTAGLIGAGLLLLETRPVLGGLALGLVSYKPNFLPLIILALLAGRKWRALLAALVGTAALASASRLVLGEKVWIAFFRSALAPVTWMQDQVITTQKMVTVFSSALSFGAGARLAWALQLGFSSILSALVALLWWRGAPFPVRAAALGLGIVLVTPYAWPYDLTIVALPIAWLAQEGLTRGWNRREPEVLFAAWLLPLLTNTFAFLRLNVLVPILLSALFVLVWRRRLTGRSEPGDVRPGERAGRAS